MKPDAWQYRMACDTHLSHQKPAKKERNPRSCSSLTTSPLSSSFTVQLNGVVLYLPAEGETPTDLAGSRHASPVFSSKCHGGWLHISHIIKTSPVPSVSCNQCTRGKKDTSCYAPGNKSKREQIPAID